MLIALLKQNHANTPPIPLYILKNKNAPAINTHFRYVKKKKSQLSSEQKHVCICNPTVFVFSGKSANMIPWEMKGMRADV